MLYRSIICLRASMLYPLKFQTINFMQKQKGIPSKQKKQNISLSQGQIMLFSIRNQLSYTLFHHEFFPNIFYYAENRYKEMQQNPQAFTDGHSSVCLDSKINQEASSFSYPFDCMGIVKGFDCSSPFRMLKNGGGSLIAPNLVLTSASLIVESSTGEIIKELIFIPKTNKKQAQIQYSIDIIATKLPQSFLKKYNTAYTNPNQDYALLLLKEQVIRDRYLYIGYDSNKEQKAEIVGYSLSMKLMRPAERNVKQMVSTGRIVQVEEQVFYHNIQTGKGWNGAPLIVQYSNSLQFLVGIHSGIVKLDKNYSACRITSSKIQILKRWSEQLTTKPSKITSIRLIDYNLRKTSSNTKILSLSQQIQQVLQRMDQSRRRKDIDQLKFYLGRAGQLCWRNGQYNRSIILLQQGLRLSLQSNPVESLQSAFFYSNLGLGYEKLKYYDQAYDNFRMSLQIHKRRKGEMSSGVAVAYNNIGNIFKRKGRYEKAFQYYNKSLKIKLKLFGEKSEGVAASLSNLALLQWQKKNYPQAIKKYKECLGIYKSVYGPVHFQISRTIYNLSLCYFDTHDYSNWLQKHYQSLVILKELKLLRHPSYKKRKGLLKDNLSQILNHPMCNSQMILKVLKIVPEIFDSDQIQPFMIKARKKLESFN